jgi:acetyl-CoA synthetase
MRVLVTTADLYNSLVAPVRDRLPGLQHVLIAGIGRLPAGTLRLNDLIAQQPDSYRIPPTPPDHPALLHLTGHGAVQHPHATVLGLYVSALFGLDLHPDDVFWCTADPGLPTGTWYGLIGALTHGVTVVTDAGPPDSRRRLRILRDEWVTVWHSSVPVLRSLMLPGMTDDVALPALRHVVSSATRRQPASCYGAATYSDTRSTPRGASRPRAASFSRTSRAWNCVPARPACRCRASMPPSSAWTAAEQVPPVRSGVLDIIDKPDEIGEFAIRAEWPSMCRGPERAGPPVDVVDGWYLSGKLASRDPDGYFWFTTEG